MNPMVTEKVPSIASAFIVSGDNFDPSDCTTIFELEPTTITVRGQPRASNRPNAPTTSWCVEIKRHALSIDEVLREVIEVIWPRRDVILTFTKSASLKVTFTSHVKIYSERPEYCLSAVALERMAYFKAEFCLDIFDVS
jgi:Domain of unknown function (DUF4279)